MPALPALAAAALAALALAACVSPGASNELDGPTGKADDVESRCSHSPLFDAITRSAMRFATGGSAPADYLLTTGNALEKGVALEADIFERTRQLILTARHQITIETWEWSDGTQPSDAVLDAIEELSHQMAAERATSSVDVYILINIASLWNQAVVTKVSERIKNSSIDGRYVTIKLATYEFSLLAANHSKSIVVDGRRALVQGLNLNDEHDEPSQLFDSAYVVEGEAAYTIQRAFSYLWEKGEQWMCSDQLNPYELDDYGLKHGDCWRPNQPVPALAMAPVEGVCEPVLVTTTRPHTSPFNPRHDTPMAQAFLAAVDHAESSILILTPNLNEEAMVDALARAVARGVAVDLVLSKGMNALGESLPGRGGTNQEIVSELFNRLDDLDDLCTTFNARWFSRDGVEAVVGLAHSSHAKYMSVDGDIAIVGSANLDNQSWYNSRELNIVVDNDEIVASWDSQVFDPVLRQSVPVAQCE